MTSHCHGKTEDSVSLKKLQLRQSCKRKAENDLTERPRKIIVTEGQSMETDGLNQRDIDNVRKAMWRQRRKHQPKLPISRMDALRAISEIETRQDVKIVTDDETQIACVYSPSAMIRDGPSRPAKLSDRKKHDWMKSSIAECVDGSLTTHAFLRRICNASLPRTNLH
ncbi:hypothetical protein RRG08_025739 [Elysia crispata]|uniref:Uncharacterized protein n=1 Tax=Elysia crispata TaxID=231223 RepID=A0AAE1AHT2_9GAST|nr:hypothetical protein RRG08_025739 [Elysia crispata]